MSVSIKLSPTSKIFRVSMGRNGFDNWIKSMEVVKETNFVNEKELVTTLKQSGLSFIQHGNTYRTNLDSNYLLWEKRAGKWVAIFNRGDEVFILMNRIEKAAERSIFSQSKTTQKVRTQSFPTNFKDINLLKAVLEDNAITYRSQGQKLTCQIDGKQLVFSQPGKNGMIVVEASAAENLSEVYNKVSVLDEDYQSKIQENTYQNFIQKAEERGFVIEQEEVLEDNSIMLTVNVMN